MKKNIRDYLNLTDKERRMLDAIDKIPADLMPWIERMLNGNSKEFEQAAEEFCAIMEIRRKYKNM